MEPSGTRETRAFASEVKFVLPRATGLAVILLSWFGIISVLLALIPVVAISPILLYIGMLIGAQAFQENPKRHAPAVVLALAPHFSASTEL